jgi:hypothetical protein
MVAKGFALLDGAGMSRDALIPSFVRETAGPWRREIWISWLLIPIPQSMGHELSVITRSQKCPR